MPEENIDAPVTAEDQTNEISQENEETSTTETDNPSGNIERQAKNNVKARVDRTFTQTQVNELVGSRLERQKNSFFKKYEVENEKEFENLIGMSQAYKVMKERYEDSKNKIKSLTEKLAFNENNINPERYDDIRAYFKGKELEFSNESLTEELATHPEWLNVVKQDTTPKTTIENFSVGHDDHVKEVNDSEKRHRIFNY